MFDGTSQTTHLLDWGSSKHHRSMKSTLACESSSAARAFDRGSFARTMKYDIEQGLKPRFETSISDILDRRAYWESICHHLPMAFGTDCKSLYDVWNKTGSFPEDRRVALDLLDVRESIEQFGGVIRWTPTDHMLVCSFTKNMPADLLTNDLHAMVYSLKYDKDIKETNRALAKVRKALREKKDDLNNDKRNADRPVNHVRNMLILLTYRGKPGRVLHIASWCQIVALHGYREANLHVVHTYCRTT